MVSDLTPWDRVLAPDMRSMSEGPVALRVKCSGWSGEAETEDRNEPGETNDDETSDRNARQVNARYSGVEVKRSISVCIYR